MKQVVLVLAAILFFGCGIEEEMPTPEEGQSTEEGQSIDDEAEVYDIDVDALCSSGGGTCRKSACRANETRNARLECGTDAQCCVPVQAATAQARCESAGGTCRKSACRTNEVWTDRYECGTDAACCVPQ